jgi:hypothetical protein
LSAFRVRSEDETENAVDGQVGTEV